MTPSNQEGRRRAPERIQQLSAVARPLYFTYRMQYWTGAELVRNAAYQQYPEAFQQQPTTYQEMDQRANREATNTLINTVGQGATQAAGATVQAPGVWQRHEEVRTDAPQGPFDPEFIQSVAQQPAPGFADLYGRQAIQMPEADIRDEAARGIAEFEQMLMDNANQSQMEDA